MKQKDVDKLMEDYFREKFLTYQITEADRRIQIARKKLRNCYLHKQKLVKIREKVIV